MNMHSAEMAARGTGGELVTISPQTGEVIQAGHYPVQIQRTAAEIVARTKLKQQVMEELMQPKCHFDTVPGCGDKPTLLKPGAELLMSTFCLYPDVGVDIKEMDNGHREYSVTVRMRQIGTDGIVGMGVGSCSTLESKYRYRTGSLICPECKQETIFKNKEGDGYYCWTKKGGCGRKFDGKDQKIAQQKIGKIENPDIADQYNTCLKMAKKRALIDAVLTATAASDIFTQDIEEMADKAPVVHAPAPAPSKSSPARVAPQKPSHEATPFGEDAPQANSKLVDEICQMAIRLCGKDKATGAIFERLTGRYGYDPEAIMACETVDLYMRTIVKDGDLLDMHQRMTAALTKMEEAANESA